MAAMLVPNSKEINEILLLKRDQHGHPHIIASQELAIIQGE
jgi:hypothetical protein